MTAEPALQLIETEEVETKAVSLVDHARQVKVIDAQSYTAICDCCKKEFDNDMDLQEFLTYYNTGGYSRESQIHVT